MYWKREHCVLSKQLAAWPFQDRARGIRVPHQLWCFWGCCCLLLLCLSIWGQRQTQNCAVRLTFPPGSIDSRASDLNHTSVWAQAPVRPQRMRKYRLAARFPLALLHGGKQCLQVPQGPDSLFPLSRKQCPELPAGKRKINWKQKEARRKYKTSSLGIPQH